jgi:zinc transport system substrate-binding protein
MQYLKKFFFTCFVILFCCNCYAKELNILVSITPIYSLVKNVTGNLQNVQLLIDKNMCPHHYQLRPSDVRKINNADMIITIGDGYETFLFNYLNKVNVVARIIRLTNTPGLKLLPIKKKSLTTTQHRYPDLMHFDLNFWSSTKNAEVIVKWIASELSTLDPKHAQIYSHNAQATLAKLSKLNLKMKKILAPVTHKNFIVLEDEYQYLEKEYDLSNVGTVVADHNLGYSAQKLRQIKNTVAEKNAKCILIEPHTPKTLVKKISRVTGAKVAYVDIEWGHANKKTSDKNLYFSIMEYAAQNISKCLSD